MSELAPSIIVAIIISIVALIIALITLFNDRIGERSKLSVAVRNQEIRSRITSLHLSIQILQRAKNELKQLVDFITPLSSYDKYEILGKLNDTSETFMLFRENFEDLYSSGFNSLNDIEKRVLHSLIGEFDTITDLLNNIRRIREYNENTITELKDSLITRKNTLSNLQNEYRDIRMNIIGSAKI